MKTHLLALSTALLAQAAQAGVIPGSGAPSAATLGATTATQLAFATSGTGHQLIAPYFSTQAGNATLVSLINTDAANGKVVKVRFRGAANGDTLMDFTVLLGPLDTWTATVLAATADGPSGIATGDSTCTVPRLPSGTAQPFSTLRVSGANASERNAQTREGYLEVINVADMPSAAFYGAGGNTTSALSAATTIQRLDLPGGAPPACTESAIAPALVAGNLTSESAAAALGLAGPTGGLVGKWSVINVPQTTTYSGDMAAIRAVDAQGRDARANFVLFPQIGALYDAGIDRATADPLLRTQAFATLSETGAGSDAKAGPVVRANYSDLPDLSTPYIAPVSDAQAPLAHAANLSAAMAVRSLVADFTNEPAISGVTDWVHVLPTRRYSVADTPSVTPQGLLFSGVVPGVRPYFYSGNTWFIDRARCVTAARSQFRSREGYSQHYPGALFTGTPPALVFCGAVAVHGLDRAENGASATQASLTWRALAVGSSSGWGQVDWLNTTTGLGMPIFGGSFFRATNPSAMPGVSGTYGIATQSTLLK